MTIDGVALAHSRWITLESPPGALPETPRFRYTTNIGNVDLRGGASTRLEVLVYEAAPGDAAISLSGGAVEVASRTRRPVGLADLRGTIAPGCALDLACAAGAVALSEIKDLRSLQIEAASGIVTLTDVAAGNVNIRNQAGNIHMIRCLANQSRTSAASGGIALEQCTFLGPFDAVTASGAVALVGGEFPKVNITTADGAIRLNKCKIVSAQALTGSGDIDAVDAIFTKPPSLRSARGAVKR